MASFFTPDFPSTIVHAKWHQRRAYLRAHQLQASNDALYAVVRDSLLARRGELHAALLTAVATASTPADLQIPLWTYHTAHYLASVGSLDYEVVEATEVLLRDKGYRWMVGLAYREFDPDTFAYDSYEWDAIWRWRTPQSVHDVVRHTDFLARLALLFEDDGYRVSYRVAARKVLSEPTDVVVERVELVLHYHPNGLYDHLVASLRAASLKYESHVAECATWDRPFVWQGRPDLEAATPPSSPTASAAAAAPPPLIRRSNAEGIQVSDLEEVAQELFLPTVDDPHTPPTACHCGYHHDEEA